MADEYLSTCKLIANGRVIEDFTEFTDNTREPAAAVNLMNKTGFMKKTQRYGFKVSYVEPASSQDKFNWETMDGTATFVATFEGGRKVTYSDVAVTSVGELKSDGENAGTRAIEMIAADRFED